MRGQDIVGTLGFRLGFHGVMRFTALVSECQATKLDPSSGQPINLIRKPIEWCGMDLYPVTFPFKAWELIGHRIHNLHVKMNRHLSVLAKE